MKRGDEPSPTGLLEDEQAAQPAGGGRPAAAVGDGSGAAGVEVPQLADGVTLIGEFEQSGFKEAPSLARRSDGQVVQLTELLYFTLEAVDGHRDLEAIAAEVSGRLGRTATADNIAFLLAKKLRPLGLLKNPDGSEPAISKSNPLLALRWKFVVSSERLTNRVTAPFAALFHSPVVVVVVAGFVAICGWTLFVRGMAQGTREALYSPGLLLMVFTLTVLSAGFHEFGHAAACRYSGGRPGVMGAGIYLVWPAFYTDVTDAYRLDRRGRLRTALGGLYFNTLFILGTFGAWAVTGSEVFLLFVPLQLFQMLHQLLPVVRMDGYYILSDLTGVPDLFARVKPTLKSAVPGKEADERALQLKPWVRVTVTAWVLVVIPLLLVSVVLAAISLPRVASTAWDSVGRQWDVIARQAGDGRWLETVVGVLAIGALILPIAGTVCILFRTARRLATRAWGATSGRPVWRSLAAGGAVAATAAVTVLWWPNGEYEPIRPGERGTLTQGVKAVRDVGTGRPGLTQERADELQATTGVPGPDPAPTTEGSPAETTDSPTTTMARTPAPVVTTTLPRVTTTVPAATTTVVRSTPTPTSVPAPGTGTQGDPTP